MQFLCFSVSLLERFQKPVGTAESQSSWLIISSVGGCEK